MPHTQSHDGIGLYYHTDHASEVRSTAILLHGFGDHCHRYDRFVKDLNERGVSVLRFDFRGHGRSEGKRGHVMSFSDYLEDLSVMLEIYERELQPTRRLLLAHSNGSLIAAHALASLPALKSWDAAVLSSPFFAIKVKVPFWKSFMASRLSRLVPSLQLPTELAPEMMSHDPEIIAAYGSDPLIGRVASARWFTETLKAHQSLESCLSQIELPSLWQLSGADHIVDVEVTLQRFEQLQSSSKKLSRYDECYHEIWFEEESRRAPLMNELWEFLESYDLVNPEGDT